MVVVWLIIWQGGHKPGKPGILGISLNMENSWNSQGIQCNLGEKLQQIK